MIKLKLKFLSTFRIIFFIKNLKKMQKSNYVTQKHFSEKKKKEEEKGKYKEKID